MILLFLALQAATPQTPGDQVRIVTDPALRKSCQYLGIVSGKRSGGTRNPEKALKKALDKVAKLGGNGLFIVSQMDNWLEGTTVTGEALLCPEGSL